METVQVMQILQRLTGSVTVFPGLSCAARKVSPGTTQRAYNSMLHRDQVVLQRQGSPRCIPSVGLVGCVVGGRRAAKSRMRITSMFRSAEGGTK